jgi:hypothetical protein
MRSEMRRPGGKPVSQGMIASFDVPNAAEAGDAVEVLISDDPQAQA